MQRGGRELGLEMRLATSLLLGLLGDGANQNQVRASVLQEVLRPLRQVPFIGVHPCGCILHHDSNGVDGPGGSKPSKIFACKATLWHSNTGDHFHLCNCHTKVICSLFKSSLIMWATPFHRDLLQGPCPPCNCAAAHGTKMELPECLHLSCVQCGRSLTPDSCTPMPHL